MSQIKIRHYNIEGIEFGINTCNINDLVLYPIACIRDGLPSYDDGWYFKENGEPKHGPFNSFEEALY